MPGSGTSGSFPSKFRKSLIASGTAKLSEVGAIGPTAFACAKPMALTELSKLLLPASAPAAAVAAASPAAGSKEAKSAAVRVSPAAGSVSASSIIVISAVFSAIFSSTIAISSKEEERRSDILMTVPSDNVIVGISCVLSIDV